MAEIARPCDPDDIHRSAMRLYRLGMLTRAHLRVLAELGVLIAGTGGTVSWPSSQDRLWQEALARLESELRAKGIVT